MSTRKIRLPRVPGEYQGIQVNHCKDPTCANFGTAASQKDGRGRKASDQDSYRLTGGGSSSISLICTVCKRSSSVKSNLAIVEEQQRLLESDGLIEIIRCPNSACSQHRHSADQNVGFTSNGKTPSGSQRYRCKECGTAFTPGVRQRRQRRPEINSITYRLLVNKMPMRRICETASIPPATLYSKINHIFLRSRAFAAQRERLFSERFHPESRLFISTDKQDYVFNWGTQLDRRNVMLSAIGSVDNISGYVLGMHLNFDPGLDPERVETEAKNAGDYDRPVPFRRHARLWLQKDYLTAMLDPSIECDTDYSHPPSGTKRPPLGMQVRTDYTMLGHFFFLDTLCAKVEKIRFFLDRDAGMQAACSAAFLKRIERDEVDIFSISHRNQMSVNERKLKKAGGERLVHAYLDQHPGINMSEAKRAIIREALLPHYRAGNLHQTWLKYPLPDMGEPDKSILMATNPYRYQPDHLAALYRKASLRGVDKFFMQVRRRLSIFERPIHTASSANRSWYGYSGYNPAVGVQLLGLFRVFYNFVLLGDDKRTPAMRLGLAHRPYELDEILDT